MIFFLNGTEMLAELGNVRLRLHYDIDGPIKLVDLTLALSSFARQYRKFLRRQMREEEKEISDSDVKLYIDNIQSGSIEAILAGGSELLGAVMPVFDYVSVFLDFSNYFNATIDYFKGTNAKKSLYSKQDCDDVYQICQLVAKNNDGTLGLETIEYAKLGRKTHLQLSFTQRDCIEAQQGAIREKRLLDATVGVDYPAVALRWYQTNIGEARAEGRTGDRAIVDKILPGKDLPTYFASQVEEEKNAMLENHMEKYLL